MRRAGQRRGDQGRGLRGGRRAAVRRALRGLARRLELRRRGGDGGAPARGRLHRRVVLAHARARSTRATARGYLRAICLGSFLERLPEELREPFLAAVARPPARPARDPLRAAQHPGAGRAGLPTRRSLVTTPASLRIGSARAAPGATPLSRITAGARAPPGRPARPFAVPAPMSLRPFLSHLERHPDAARLAEPDARAFVSQSLRAYLIAAVADRDERRPTVVVAGDDRAARDLAADLRAWLRPRPVRFYPSRGVAYESHLSPPAHLVGLRVAALDALLEPPGGAGGARRRRLRRRPLREGPRPGAAPARLRRCAPATCSTSRSAPPTSSRPATSAWTRSRTAASSPSAAACSTSTPPRRSAPSASTCSTTRSSRCAGSPPSPSARSARPTSSRSRPPPSWPPSTASWPSSPRSRRPTSARTSPSCCPSATSASCSSSSRPRPRSSWPRRRTPSRRCATTGRTSARPSTTPTRTPSTSSRTASSPRSAERRPLRLSSISGTQELEFRAQAADFAARSLREAEPELEKLVRSGYTALVTWPNRGGGERAAYNLARVKARWEANLEPGLVFQEANLRDGFVAPGLNLAAVPEHRLIHHRKATARPARRGRGLLRSFTDLRTGDFIVHEDHGVARFAGFDTKTVGGITRDYLNLEFQGVGQGLHAGRPAREDLALRRRGRLPSAALQARRHALGGRSRRAPAGPRRSSRGSCSTSTRSAAAGAATPSSPTRTGCASSRPPSPTRRRPTSARRSSWSRPTWSPTARWTA